MWLELISASESCREQKKAAGVGASKASEDALTASTYDDIKALEDHWQQLDDERKTVYAQMAVLTRHAVSHGRIDYALPEFAANVGSIIGL